MCVYVAYKSILAHGFAFGLPGATAPNLNFASPVEDYTVGVGGWAHTWAQDLGSPRNHIIWVGGGGEHGLRTPIIYAHRCLENNLENVTNKQECALNNMKKATAFHKINLCIHQRIMTLTLFGGASF